MIESSDIQCQNMSLTELPSSIRRDMGLQHHTTVLHKLFFEVFALHVENIVQKAFCKERRSPLPTQTSTINSQRLIASAMFLWREYNPCVMPSNLYSQVFLRYPCSGPVRRSQADLVVGILELKAKTITSPERTSRDCLLIRFSESSFKPSLDRPFPH